MEQNKMVSVNWDKNKVCSKSDAIPSFEKCYLTGLYGRKLIYYSKSIHKNSQHIYLQHCIVVDLKSPCSTIKHRNATETDRVKLADISIIPACTDYWSRIESEESEAIILSIEPDLLKRIASDKIETNSIELKAVFSQSDLLIQSIALNIKKELDSQTCDRIYVESLFQALLMHLLKNYCIKKYAPASARRALPSHRLLQAIDYIEQNLDEKIETKDLAKLVGVSQYYFCRLFREATGVAPYRYVIQQRICRAKKLIEENKLSLLDIAIECGFSSQSQMTYHFGKLVGTTPKVYRDRV